MATPLATTRIENVKTIAHWSGNTRIGIFGHSLADYIVREFNKKRGQHKERTPERVRASIVKRGRGHRNIYLDSGTDVSDINRYHKIDCRNQDLPLDYAPFVALYLVVNYNDSQEKQDRAVDYVAEILETIKFIVQ